MVVFSIDLQPHPTKASNKPSLFLLRLSRSISSLLTSFLAMSRSAGNPAYSATHASSASTLSLSAVKAVCCSSISAIASAELMPFDAGVAAAFLACTCFNEDNLSSDSRIFARRCFACRACSVVCRCSEGGVEKAGSDCSLLSWARSRSCCFSRHVCSAWMCAMLLERVCETDV